MAGDLLRRLALCLLAACATSAAPPRAAATLLAASCKTLEETTPEGYACRLAAQCAKAELPDFVLPGMDPLRRPVPTELQVESCKPRAGGSR